MYTDYLMMQWPSEKKIITANPHNIFTCHATIHCKSGKLIKVTVKYCNIFMKREPQYSIKFI